jgi:hypothetical protein
MRGVSTDEREQRRWGKSPWRKALTKGGEGIE